MTIGLVIVVLHIFGARLNRNKAKAWARAHAPIMLDEYALVGFGGVATQNNDKVKPESLLKEKSLFEFATYATGRQNTAFMDVKLTMTKRFNPMMNFIESAFSFFAESTFPAPVDSMEAHIYPFDGKESLTVPRLPNSDVGKDSKSSYDGFVWAIVNKTCMQKVRDERYDLSLTVTKDHPKLADWLTIMSENAEITNTLLTDELIAAVTQAGSDFEYIIISDQPADKPKTLEESSPSKRAFLRYRLPSSNNYDTMLPVFSYFQRLPDLLVQSAHFRPEVLKKVRNTREQMVKELKKVADEEKAEERALEREKTKKAKRDADLKGLDAKQQKKYLEKEKEKEMRKAQKKQTQRA